jgi:predicted ArsR family transcriptional regulator
MTEKNPSTTAALLRLSAARQDGVLQMAKELRVGPSKLIRMLAELRDEGLLDIGVVRTRSAGRPKRRVRVTALGREYLVAYEALKLKSLKSRRTDLRKAVADTNYARRLVARGVSPYELFLELNALGDRARRPAV